MKYILIFILISFSYKNANNEKFINHGKEYCLIKIEVNSATNDWGDWQKNSCYSGIYYRTRSTGSNVNDIQFQNTYKYHRVFFSYSFWANRSETKYWDLGGRTGCGANGGLSPIMSFICPPNTTYWLKIEKLRFDSERNRSEDCDR